MDESPKDLQPPKPPLRRKKKEMGLALQAFLFGLGSYAVGALLFFVLYAKEQTGGTMRAHGLIWLLYLVGGKWFVAVAFGLIGTFFLAGCILLLVKPAKNPAQPPEFD